MLQAIAMTDIGKKRKLNQDFVFASRQPVGNLPNLFIVADGMGGHKAGDYASKCTVETIVAEATASSDTVCSSIFEAAIERANNVVRSEAGRSSDYTGMGSTVVTASCRGDVLDVANVGDSRLYVIGDTIRQVTRDHSLVEEMIRMGGLAREDARNHPEKHVITRAIGAAATVKTDTFTVELTAGDIVLMCSDGLTNMLTDDEIYQIVKEKKELRPGAEELVRAANEKGGADNIAVVLIDPFAEDIGS